uniref:RNase H type-1 domain-containing protein n=1 Tax=Quercus lobata TaxID=97700 RepID=A0A7N2R7L0_QUELO
MLHFLECLMERLKLEELELFLVQAWFVWHQRNCVVHGERVQDSVLLNKRAVEYLEDFRNAQVRLDVVPSLRAPSRWQPPLAPSYKLNFDGALFLDPPASGYGMIIRNDKGEVMTAYSVQGPLAADSGEMEILACCYALEFALDLSFHDLFIEGDNASVMRSIADFGNYSSRFGHILLDIHASLSRLSWFTVSHIHKEDNFVAHSLARYARLVSHDVV